MRFTLVSFFLFLSIHSWAQTKIEVKDAINNIGKDVLICHSLSSYLEGDKFDPKDSTLILNFRDTLFKDQRASTPMEPDPPMLNFVSAFITTSIRKQLDFNPTKLVGKSLCIRGVLLFINQRPVLFINKKEDLTIQ